ncbi:Patellin-6 [Vitis vinifera]|uniref:Patellin-6 n=1 Tax=Vitis vinifera TaxID=29760 RepID=A0A438J6B7_VITVI|nr:Patellin-6 [Vitis vinifera]
MAGTGSFREDDEVGNVFGQEELYKRGGRLSAEDFSQRGAGGGGRLFGHVIDPHKIPSGSCSESIHGSFLTHLNATNQPEASPRPSRKSFVTSLMEAANLALLPSRRTPTSCPASSLQRRHCRSSKTSSWPLMGPTPWSPTPFTCWRSAWLGEKSLERMTSLRRTWGLRSSKVSWLTCTGTTEKNTQFATTPMGFSKDKDMYEGIFGDEEKLKKFLRWRVQVLVLERGIKLLHFKPGGVNSIIQDLKDMPKRELRVASNQNTRSSLSSKIIIEKWLPGRFSSTSPGTSASCAGMALFLFYFERHVAFLR